MKVTIVFGDQPELKPVKVVVVVDNEGSVKDLEKKLFEILAGENEEGISSKVSESTHRWAIADIFKAKVYKFFDPDAKVREISDKDVIFAYCLPKVENQTKASCSRWCVIANRWRRRRNHRTFDRVIPDTKLERPRLCQRTMRTNS